MTGKKRLKGHGPEHVYNTLCYIDIVFLAHPTRMRAHRRGRKGEGGCKKVVVLLVLVALAESSL